MAIDWWTIAKDNGFESPGALFETWYDENQMSLADIAKEVGVSTWAVKSAMEKFGVSTRPRGGDRYQQRRK